MSNFSCGTDRRITLFDTMSQPTESEYTFRILTHNHAQKTKTPGELFRPARLRLPLFAP